MKEQALVMFTGAGSFTIVGILLEGAKIAAKEHSVRFVLLCFAIGLLYTVAKILGLPVEATH